VVVGVGLAEAVHLVAVGQNQMVACQVAAQTGEVGFLGEGVLPQLSVAAAHWQEVAGCREVAMACVLALKAACSGCFVVVAEETVAGTSVSMHLALVVLFVKQPSLLCPS